MYIFISASLALKLTLILHCTFHIALILNFTCYDIYIIFLYPILLYSTTYIYLNYAILLST